MDKVKKVAMLMAARREQLSGKPLNTIWRDLASVAVQALESDRLAQLTGFELRYAHVVPAIDPKIVQRALANHPAPWTINPDWVAYLGREDGPYECPSPILDANGGEVLSISEHVDIHFDVAVFIVASVNTRALSC